MKSGDATMARRRRAGPGRGPQLREDDRLDGGEGGRCHHTDDLDDQANLTQATEATFVRGDQAGCTEQGEDGRRHQRRVKQSPSPESLHHLVDWAVEDARDATARPPRRGVRSPRVRRRTLARKPEVAHTRMVAQRATPDNPPTVIWPTSAAAACRSTSSQCTTVACRGGALRQRLPNFGDSCTRCVVDDHGRYGHKEAYCVACSTAKTAAGRGEQPSPGGPNAETTCPSAIFLTGFLVLQAGPAAQAAPPTTTTNTEKGLVETFVDVVPTCEGGGPLYTITTTANAIEHETVFDHGRVHATFTSTGTFTATPLEDPSLPSYTARSRSGVASTTTGRR